MLTNLYIRLTTFQLPRTGNEPDTSDSNRPPNIDANAGDNPVNPWIEWGAGILRGTLIILAAACMLWAGFSILRNMKKREQLRWALAGLGVAFGVLLFGVYFNQILDTVFDTIDSGPGG